MFEYCCEPFTVVGTISFNLQSWYNRFYYGLINGIIMKWTYAVMQAGSSTSNSKLLWHCDSKLMRVKTYRLLLFLDFVTRMRVSVVTAMRSRRIMTPHTVPVMIISKSELDWDEVRLGSWLEVGSSPVVTKEAVDVENSLPVAPSGTVVPSTPACINITCAFWGDAMH